MPDQTSRDLKTSIRRTVVPAVMGWVASLPIAPFVDQAEVERALVVVLAAAYYAALRWLEDRGVDAAGWWIAFGRTPKPKYFEETDVTVRVEGDMDVQAVADDVVQKLSEDG